MFTNSPAAQLVAVDGGAHFLNWSHPSEINKAILEFVGKYKQFIDTTTTSMRCFEVTIVLLESLLMQCLSEQLALLCTSINTMRKENPL